MAIDLNELLHEVIELTGAARHITVTVALGCRRDPGGQDCHPAGNANLIAMHPLSGQTPGPIEIDCADKAKAGN